MRRNERHDMLTPTPRQVLGPYFLPDSPIRSSVASQGANAIKLTGKVTDTNGKSLSGVVMHFWLASDKGFYDNQDSQGKAFPLDPAQHRLRCRVITDAKGEYSFQFVRPGNYPLGNGQMRPAHVHVLLVRGAGHRQLVTQLYFPDDPYNEHDIPGDDFFQPELLIDFTQGQNDGHFNFVLK
jgi:protocatechuate 3,4-dioxygenase beta subunit